MISNDDMMDATKRMQVGALNFDDFLKQLSFVKGMGGFSKMVNMLPGMAGKIPDEMMFEAEKRMKTAEKMVASMSIEERTNPDLLAMMVNIHKYAVFIC